VIFSVKFSNLFSQGTNVQIWIISHMVIILSAVLTCMHLLTYKMTVDIQYVGMLIVYMHTKCYIPGSSVAVVIADRLKA
jgi:predicted thioesterase